MYQRPRQSATFPTSSPATLSTTVLGSSQPVSFQPLKPTTCFPTSGPSQILFLLPEVTSLPSTSLWHLTGLTASHRWTLSLNIISSEGPLTSRSLLLLSLSLYLVSFTVNPICNYVSLVCFLVQCLSLPRMWAPWGKGRILFSTHIPSTWRARPRTHAQKY